MNLVQTKFYYNKSTKWKNELIEQLIDKSSNQSTSFSQSEKADYPKVNPSISDTLINSV